MKLIFIGLALLATAYGQYSSEYQVPQDSLAAIEDIETLEEPSNLLADNGYRYKTVKRFRFRHRRDVNELAPEYLPPVEVPTNEYLAPVAPAAQEVELSSGVLADDGYRYKTVKRVRHRRDVSELAPEYLPPVEVPTNEYLAPVAPAAQEVELSSGILADDGYRYKTVKRVRHRRDVSELAPEYLPPVEVPTNEYLAPVAPAAQEVELSSGILADDGYRYKTVKRVRHRRDVSELAPEYLPPVQEVAIEAPTNEYLSPIAPAAQEVELSSGVLADDGYRYKTVKRFRLRHRRDVSELASPEYLPPAQELAVEAPTNEYLSPIAPAAQEVELSSGVLADDGYRYKTVKRFRLRHRRDVSELASPEYLPPVQEIAVEAPTNEYLSPIAPAAQEVELSSGVLADDGYRYKTVKRFRLRHRRDVSELASPEYLPPVQEIAVEAPTNEYLSPIAPAAQEVELSSGVLADDGYRYKTVKRFRLRHRRDVSELASPAYLPPAQELDVEVPTNEYLSPIAPAAQEVELSSGVLADDGYRYKTVKRFRLRHRRDVSELPTANYLPPQDAPFVADIPVISAEYLAPIEQDESILADDGYRYKTVRRFKIRRS